MSAAHPFQAQPASRGRGRGRGRARPLPRANAALWFPPGSLGTSLEPSDAAWFIEFLYDFHPFEES